MKKYNVVVLGAGPGGYVSAIRAKQRGASTAIIEKSKVGGTCLNEGCIPTKALIKNVEILHSIEAGKKRGIMIEAMKLDYKKAVKTKNMAVRQLVGGVEGLLSAAGVDLYQGKGIVREDNTIEIKIDDQQTEKIEYEKLIIATGSQPVLPPIEGINEKGVVTSTELLQQASVPEHLIIVGGGVIGCEFASIFNAYGAKVTIIEMLPFLVGMLDKSISKYMEDILTNLGICIRLGKKVSKIKKNKNGNLDICIEDGNNKEIISGDQILISVGRKTNLEGLEELNLNTEKSFIQIDDFLETSVDNVYAIGDVTGEKQLAHVASEMGIIAAENATGAKKRIDLDIVPSCIYTIPEIGSVGLTKKQAKERGYKPIVGQFPLIACGKAVATGEPDGIFKIVADKETRKILGAHLIGKSSTELVAEMAAYMKMDATIDDVIDTIHAHPTISEAIVEAARDIDGFCIHMPAK